MATTTSYLWDFTTVPYFFTNWNVLFSLNEMNSANNFEFVFCDYAPTNINDCLNGSVLSSNVHTITSVDCSLDWNSDTQIIKVRNDVTWNIGDNIYPIKAVFLRKKANGYVMGYCIHQNSFEVTNKVKIEKDTILWSIHNGE